MKLKKSHVILIVIGILILLGSAVTVSLIKTPPPGFPTDPNLADWLFYILADWASAGAPAVTLIAVAAALYMGFRSLNQTRAIQQRQEELAKRNQQRERIEQLATHIREWAIDVIKENFGGEVSIMPGMSVTVHKQRDAANRLLKCQELSVKGKEYIHPIASSLSEDLFNENFSNDVMSIVNVLEAIRGKIRERGQDVDNPEINEQLEDLDEQLWILGGAVIKQTLVTGI